MRVYRKPSLPKPQSAGAATRAYAVQRIEMDTHRRVGREQALRDFNEYASEVFIEVTHHFIGLGCPLGCGMGGWEGYLNAQ